MNAAFTEAVAQLNLLPGQSRRVRVNGYEIEIRRLPSEDAAIESMVMREPWVWFPDPDPITALPLQRATHPAPDPAAIPQTEE